MLAVRTIAQETTNIRLDSEYFLKEHLSDAALVQSRLSDFRTVSETGIVADASAFYPSIEEYYGSGSLPFIRVGDVDGLIDGSSCLVIPDSLCDLHPTLNRVNVGDIVFTKGGAIDRVGIVGQSAAASRDIISLNTAKFSEEDRLFLYSYFLTSFFKRSLIRSSSQTAQPHLTLGLIRMLPVLIASPLFKISVARLVKASFKAIEMAKVAMTEAENILLDAMGLCDWSPPDPLTYTRSAMSVATVGRLDANYFAPKYDAVLSRLNATGVAKRLGAGLTKLVARGAQPTYVDDGLPVINSKHVRANRVLLDESNRRALPKALRIQPGDVLVNGTGIGTIGRAAPYLGKEEALPDNHVTIVRTDELDPLFLSVFLNTPLGQMQIERMISGSSGQIELYPEDIRKIVVWHAPVGVQEQVADHVRGAFAVEARSNTLILIAKHMVEISLARDEAAALGYLAEQRETIDAAII